MIIFLCVGCSNCFFLIWLLFFFLFLLSRLFLFLFWLLFLLLFLCLLLFSLLFLFLFWFWFWLLLVVVVCLSALLFCFCSRVRSLSCVCCRSCSLLLFVFLLVWPACLLFFVRLFVKFASKFLLPFAHIRITGAYSLSCSTSTNFLFVDTSVFLCSCDADFVCVDLKTSVDDHSKCPGSLVKFDYIPIFNFKHTVQKNLPYSSYMLEMFSECISSASHPLHL